MMHASAGGEDTPKAASSSTALQLFSTPPPPPTTTRNCTTLAVPSRFLFSSDEKQVPTQLSAWEQDHLQRQESYFRNLHETSARVASLTAALAVERMNRQAEMTHFANHSVSLEEVVLRLQRQKELVVFTTQQAYDDHANEHDKTGSSPRRNTNQRKRTGRNNKEGGLSIRRAVWAMESRLDQLSADMTRSLQVTLHQTASSSSSSSLPGTSAIQTVGVHVEAMEKDLYWSAQKDDARQTTLARKVEEQAAWSSRKRVELGAARRTIQERLQLGVSDWQGRDERVATEFQTKLDEARAHLERLVRERTEQDERIRLRIKETTDRLKQALLEVVGDG